jgi:general secretion pathway protein D
LRKLLFYDGFFGLMKRRGIAVLIFCWWLSPVCDSFGQNAAPPDGSDGTGDDLVSIQLPGSPVDEVLEVYRMLTGKRLVRDANLSGPNLKVVVPDKISKAEAVALLESVLLLNGYTLVEADDNTVKVLGTGKSPLGESIPLYVDPSRLPAGDRVISYFMLLKYISTKDAMAVFDGYVSIRQQGKIVAVPNSNAILITDNAALIRRLVNLQRWIDVPGARVLTEFVPLARADAEKVAETVNKILDSEKKDDSQNPGKAVIAAPEPPPEANTGNGAPPQGVPVPLSGSEGTLTQLTTPMQVVADVRTNRILVVTTENKMPYIKKLIRDLDMAVDLEKPLERPLRFVSAGDVLPVLQSILSEGSDSGSGNSSQAAASSVRSEQIQDDFASSGGTSMSGGGTGKADKLTAPRESAAPLAVSVGKVRIIADRSANKVIVIGPPESRDKASRVLDMLDQRPKQVYLATVIGQYTLGKDLNLGIQYPGSVTGSLYVAGGNGGGAVPGTGVEDGVVENGGVDLVPGTGELVNTAVNLTAGAFSGLSIYGVIADSIDVTVRALETNNRFKIISRPVVYTANNKKAVISSGQQVPVPQSTLTSSLATDVQGASIASNIQYKDVVLKLEVIPLINSKNEVTLTIAQQNDNILETVTISENQVPVVGTQELTTTVTVPNRHTVVIGGLITEEEQEAKTGLPFLSDIPGLDYVFGAKRKNKVRRELIILIQPFIVETPEDQATANYIEKARSGLKDDFYEDPLPVRRAEPVLPPKPPPSNWTPFRSGGR